MSIISFLVGSLGHFREGQKTILGISNVNSKKTQRFASRFKKPTFIKRGKSTTLAEAEKRTDPALGSGGPWAEAKE